MSFLSFFFFFQAEDGIRDKLVTGVQTCALPIFIGMTNFTEARLAREAEICYATLSMITDYDCWHETEEAVSGEAVMQVVMANVAKIGRASCRERVENWVGGVSIEKKNRMDDGGE